MGYKELIEALRVEAWLQREKLSRDTLLDELNEAADAIETLLAERDAAMEEIRNMGCETCKHKMVDQVKCYNCFATGGWRDNWEWRGPQK